MNSNQSGIVEINGSTHDTQKYVNALGPRGVIGVMTPGPNVNVENEMMDMRPRGVINAVDRYYVPNQQIGKDEDWSIIMKNVAANLDDSVRRLNEALIDHLVLGMSSPPRQNSCRPDRTKNLGAAMKDDSGSIRTSIQRQSGGQVAAAGERLAGGGFA